MIDFVRKKIQALELCSLWFLSGSKSGSRSGCGCAFACLWVRVRVRVWFESLALFWSLGPGRSGDDMLYESLRRKPGWRFTAGFKLEILVVNLIFRSCLTIRFRWNNFSQVLWNITDLLASRVCGQQRYLGWKATGQRWQKMSYFHNAL